MTEFNLNDHERRLHDLELEVQRLTTTLQGLAARVESVVDIVARMGDGKLKGIDSGTILV